MSPYSRMPAPARGDIITLGHDPGRRYWIDEITGYYPGEGWGAELIEFEDTRNDPDNDQPLQRLSTALHEEYTTASWWQYVRRQEAV
ncbi:MAG TPA: hypothetical protein VK453_25810 [Micromonosporaceae bacterium]|nr:hypothetical protein [Micromonosporaceae bacterium]